MVHRLLPSYEFRAQWLCKAKLYTVANIHFAPCMQDFKNKILHIRMNIVFLP